MTFRLFVVDAFTDELFHGNPAGVCVLDRWPDDELMLNIAAENNLSETAFVVPSDEDFGIRWFTPKVEVDLCGHATMASAHVLFTHLGFARDEIRFHSRSSGVLKASRDGDGIVLDFPADTIRKVPAQKTLIEGLRRKPIETYRGKTKIMAIFRSERDIERMDPDFQKLVKVRASGVIVTAKGDTVDFVSRYFGPRVGVPEDPVTGSAHTLLTPYWARRLGKTELAAIQLSKRGGSLRCTLSGDRVKISGMATTYMVGEIKLGIGP
jgi:predicted PhzF superfamily epimerase YddE/YHI9